jgi:hypothetical protein
MITDEGTLSFILFLQNNPYPAPPTVASVTRRCGDPSLTGTSCPAFPRASAVELEIVARRPDMQQGIEIRMFHVTLRKTILRD